MIKFRLLLIGLLAIIPLTGLADVYSATAPENPEFVSWQKLQLGQKGFGLTVFQGTKVEKFYVEFAGTIPHPYCPTEKLILVRMGEPLKNSEVLRGMSGSPVYFEHDGKWKLVGALGYGFGVMSSDKHLGGITPIAAMLEQEKTLGLIKLPASLNKKTLEELSQPVLVGKHGDSEIYLLRPRFELVANAAKNSAGRKEPKLIAPKPGDAISVILTDGDCVLAGFGTVTYVQKDKFLAFGHPMFGDGHVVMPAYKAEIATSFKSPMGAFKLRSEILDSFGYITYDNAFAIEGKIAPWPEDAMLPVTISLKINDNGGSKKAEYNFRVVKHKIYSSLFLEDVAYELLRNVWDNKIRATTRTISTINVDGEKPLIFRDSSIVSGDITRIGPFMVIQNPWSAVGRTANTVSYLMNNEWTFNISSVEISTELEIGDKALFLDAYQILNKNGLPVEEVKPGETIKLILGLRNIDGTKQFVVKVPVTIPKNLVLKKESGSDSRYIHIYIESGNHFEERDESKLLRHRPDNKKEFLQKLLADEQDPQKFFVQIVLPKSKPERKDVKNFPELTDNQWAKVENLEFLRESEAYQQKVIVKEFDPPLPNFILNIRKSITIKLDY